jgi:RNA polymerase sigma-70 factor (ECF subfamily)
MNSGVGEFEAAYLTKLRKQDAKAFEKLFNDFSGMVYSISLSLLSDRSGSEDAVQEIFFKIFRALPAFKGNKLSSWIGKISHNHCIDNLRKRQKAPLHADVPVETVLIHSGKDTGMSDEFPEFLNELNPSEREVLVLKKVEQLSYREISEITGLAEGTLRNMVVKTMKKLKVDAHGK